jgi:hypothetical protein
MNRLTEPLGGRSLARRGLLLTAVFAAVIAGGLVIVTHTGGKAPPQTVPRVVGAPAPGPLSNATHSPDSAAASAARTFFAGYLAYRYGQGGPDQIRDASPKLIAVLSHAPLSVMAATRSLHPVVVKLGAHEAGGSVLHVTALISDGMGRYPLRIVMVHRPGGWETTQLVNPE